MVDTILETAKKLADLWPALAAIGTWVAAGATIFAVGFAIKLQRKYAKRERPILSVKIEPNSDKCFDYVGPELFPSNDNREELWLRVLVSNSGDTAARDVQIRLVEILREKAIDPQSRSNLWFKVSNLNQISLNMLPRGIDQPFDIAFVGHSIDQSSEIKKNNDKVSFYLMMVKPELDKPWIEIKEKVEISPENKLILGYKYTLRIAVLSSNADAVHYNLTLRMINPSSDPDIQEKIGRKSIKKDNLKTYLKVDTE